MKNKISLSFLFAVFMVLCIHTLMTAPTYAQIETQSMDVSRCGGVGPLDPDYCGCTWGEVYYRGQPISYMPVTLQFGNAYTITTTQIKNASNIAMPYYQTSGHELGAKHGDIMTVSTEFLGATIARSFRAIPDPIDREQHIPLVIPESGIWNSRFIGDFARSLLISDTKIWLGGDSGLLLLDLNSGITQTQDLPWSDLKVVAIAKTKNGTVWVAGTHDLAYYNGSSWEDVEVPFSATIHSMIVHPVTQALWVGGGDASGIIAVNRSDWQTATVSNRWISALAIDGSGDLWLGTWGAGVFRHDHAIAGIDQGWTQYRTKDGIASDYIYTAVADADNLLISTYPYATASGALGGISQYHFASATWQSYGITNGLPSDPNLPTAPAAIYALTLRDDGVVLGGSEQGLHLFATPSTWITDVVTASQVRAVASTGNTVLAMLANGELLQLDPQVTPGSPPSVTLPTHVYTISVSTPFSLTAQAQDLDEDGESIIGWEWHSDLDGPLCTTAEDCDLSTLSITQHQISVRVQDDEGMWSPLITAQVWVTDTEQFTPDSRVYLPVAQYFAE